MQTAVLSYSLPGVASGSVILTYHQLASAARLELTGAQTYPIDLAMMPAAGLKGLLVIYDAIDASGVTVTAMASVRWTSNGVPKNEELSPGGLFLIASPAPANGITALSIVVTANAVIHVHALG